MFESSSIANVLARALDVCALKQAVYSANVANASVDGYQRLEVQFDQAAAAAATADSAGSSAASDLPEPQVIPSGTAVKLDEEMAAMAQNALRYQTLLGVYERSASLLKLAIHEGREA